jgi:hypothetical protein
MIKASRANGEANQIHRMGLDDGVRDLRLATSRLLRVVVILRTIPSRADRGILSLLEVEFEHDYCCDELGVECWSWST